MKQLLTTCLLSMCVTAFGQNMMPIVQQVVPTLGARLQGRPSLQDGVAIVQLGSSLQRFTGAGDPLPFDQELELSSARFIRSDWRATDDGRLLAMTRHGETVVADPRADSPITMYQPAGVNAVLCANMVHSVSPTSRGAYDWVRREIDGANPTTLYRFNLDDVRGVKLLAAKETVNVLGHAIAVNVIRIRHDRSAKPSYLVMAYNLSARRMAWAVELESLHLVGQGSEGLHLTEQQALLLSSDRLIAVDLEEGSIQYTVAPHIEGSFTAFTVSEDDARIYTSHSSAGIQAYVLSSGAEIWSVPTLHAWHGDLQRGADKQIIVLCQRTQRLAGLSASKGQLLWTHDTAQEEEAYVLGSLQVAGKSIVVSTQNSLHFISLNHSNLQASMR